jgi:putative transposase
VSTFFVCVIPEIFRTSLKHERAATLSMRLTMKKMVRIVKRKQIGLSSALIAKQFGLSKRRIEQIWSHYSCTGEYLILQIPGRKPYRKRIPDIDDKVKRLHQRFGFGATYIAKYLRMNYNLHLSNNFIHEILLDNKMAIEEKNKKKRKKPWIRYERTHSLTAVHLDWHFNPDTELWVCAVLDDASRKILSGGEYEQALGVHGINMLDESYEKYKHIKPIEQVITDHGSQFYANKKNKDDEGEVEFQIYCRAKGIKHILCKYHHPQTNGKYEKWNDTYQTHRAKFKTFQEFVDWYNNRPHGSHNLKTPEWAFWHKAQDIILGRFYIWADKNQQCEIITR